MVAFDGVALCHWRMMMGIHMTDPETHFDGDAAVDDAAADMDVAFRTSSFHETLHKSDLLSMWWYWVRIRCSNSKVKNQKRVH
jgi:hypothetical protein